MALESLAASFLGGGGGGSNLIGMGVQALSGLANVFFSGRKRAERELNDTVARAPKYTGDRGIASYYQQALNRYNTNPTDSAMFIRNMRDINRGTTNALGQLQDRRAGIAGVGAINRQANDATLNAQVQAENQRNQRFSQLGGATQMQNQDNRYKFQTNEVDPFQLKLSLASMKSQAANSRFNAGLQTLNNLGQNVGMMSGGIGGNKKKNLGYDPTQIGGSNVE